MFKATYDIRGYHLGESSCPETILTNTQVDGYLLNSADQIQPAL